jgi:hypothetical protein
MRMLITTAAVVTSLALAGASAMAADANVHKTAKAHAARAHAAVHVAARQRYPHYARAPSNYGSQNYNVGQVFQSVLGGGWPAFYANLPHDAARGRGTRYAPAGSSDDNSQAIYENSPPVIVDNSQSQAAIEATDQAIQQVDQDTFQMDEAVINNNNGM